MRWRFFDPTNRQEAVARKATIAQIDAWWKKFQGKTDDLRAVFAGKSRWDLPEWMEKHLQSIDERLMWEYGPAIHTSGHRLVITPESEYHLRPLVAAILERAPKIKGWEFYEYRLPEDLEGTQTTVQGRTGCDCSDFTVHISRGENHRIDLRYTSPGFTDENDQTANHAAFIATETLLGEQCLNRWIGAIEVSPPASPKGRKSTSQSRTRKPPHYIELDRLKETVDALIESIRDQLPEKPHHSWIRNARWTLWELKPDQTEDEFAEQTDLFVGKSANPDMWTAAHAAPRSFYSERFSRRGETFCYVKLDGSLGMDPAKFADKAEIEDALDRALGPAMLGCSIGGGTGLRYSYIDLALTDLDRGIQAVKQRLQAGNVPKRSWIQFFDADLTAEWIGIYDETPPPPMAVEDE